MKVALCFSGQSRFIEQGYKSLSTNLANFSEMDVFVHTWASAKSLEIPKYYSNIKDYIIEEQRYDITQGDADIPSHFIDANGEDGIVSDGLEPDAMLRFVHYSMFYSIFKSNQLKSHYEHLHNFKYDCVIRVRFDIALSETTNLDDFDLNYVNMLTPCHDDVVSDFINFGTSRIMDIYSNVWQHMPELKEQDVMMTAGEELITAHLNNNHIKHINKDELNTVSLIRG